MCLQTVLVVVVVVVIVVVVVCNLKRLLLVVVVVVVVVMMKHSVTISIVHSFIINTFTVIIYQQQYHIAGTAAMSNTF
jgi:hypothetical protein